MTKQDHYLALADTLHEIPEHQRSSRMMLLEFVANLRPEFKTLRTAVRNLKAGA